MPVVLLCGRAHIHMSHPKTTEYMCHSMQYMLLKLSDS